MPRYYDEPPVLTPKQKFLRFVAEKYQDRDLLTWLYCVTDHSDLMQERGMSHFFETQKSINIIWEFKNLYAKFNQDKGINAFMRSFFSQSEELTYQRFYDACVKRFTSGEKNHGVYVLEKNKEEADLIDPGVSNYIASKHGVPSFTVSNGPDFSSNTNKVLANLNSAESLERYAYFQRVFQLFDNIERTPWVSVDREIKGQT